MLITISKDKNFQKMKKSDKEDFNKYHIYKNNLDDLIKSLNNKRKELNDLYKQIDYDYDSLEDVNDYEFLVDEIKKIKKMSKEMFSNLSKTDFVMLKDEFDNNILIYKEYSNIFNYFISEKKRIAKEISDGYNESLKNSFLEPSYISVDYLKKHTKRSRLTSALIKGASVKNEFKIKKEEFRKFLVNELQISDEYVLNKCLDEYDMGLLFNVNFNILLYSLGFNDDIIEYIINRFDPELVDGVNYKEDNYNSLNKGRDVIKGTRRTIKVTVPKIKFTKKQLDKETIERIKKNAENATVFIAASIIIASTSAKLSNLNVEKTQDKPVILDSDIVPREESNNDLYIGQSVILKDNAKSYNNVKDAYNKQNPTRSSYENVERVVRGIVIDIDGHLVFVDDNNNLDQAISDGGQIVGFLASVYNMNDGFYNIGSIKRGVTR